jgi:hypothetical protein
MKTPNLFIWDQACGGRLLRESEQPFSVVPRVFPQ